MVLEMLQESGCKSLRQLHIWLERECESRIPERSYYRYVRAAKYAKKVEAVYGKKMLTEVGSLKALEMLANPPIPPEPHEGPKPALDEPPPRNWQGQSIRHPAANNAVKEGDDVCMEKTLETPEHTFAQTIIYTGCKNFKIENDRVLSFIDQHGDSVIVTSEQTHIGALLVNAVSRYKGKKRK